MYIGNSYGVAAGASLLHLGSSLAVLAGGRLGRGGGFRGNALIWLIGLRSLNTSGFEDRCNRFAANPASELIVLKCIKSFKLAVIMYQTDVDLFILVFCDV